MNADVDPKFEEEFTARLIACDEALARGTALPDVGGDAPTQLQTRLLRGLACVRRLHELRPQRDTDQASDACPTRIGRFEIHGLIGRGGFGIVYRAYDPVLKRDVALEIPRADVLLDVECRGRLEREARAAAGLEHPNLVPVHEAGRLGPISFIAFAYCPGCDLAAWLRAQPPIGCVAAARLLRILARAVHYAHGRGILHRDLKPSNVLLSPVEPAAGFSSDTIWLPRADNPLLPRLTDFGLAKSAAGDPVQTQSGALLGTPTYMAPEQADGRLAAVGPATDVYALGVILYEVLTGRPPFWGESTVAILLQVRSLEAPPPSRIRPEVPRDLETICLKCLNKEPRKRYASAGALADDLDRFLTGAPIQARPTGRLEHALKWARRHPALAASYTALFLVSFFGTLALFVQWQKTQTALNMAVAREQEAHSAQVAEAREREHSEVTLYHHRVNLAHHEWLAGNVGRAGQLLDGCRPDLRNWEWRYVRRLCDSALISCAAHATHVMGVTFSSDGKRLASVAGQWNSSDPGEVKLWDATTGALLWTGPHAGPAMCVAFSPDGTRVASATVTWGGSKTGEIKIWDSAAGRLLVHVPGLPKGIFGVAFSPDGSRLATAGADRTVRLWDPETGKELAVLEGHKANVFSVAFSPDGRLLASAGWDGTALIWDLATRRPMQSLRGPNDLRSVAFSADGERLLAASFDQSVKIWEIKTGKLLQSYWGHRSPALCAAFAPDGKHVASCDTSGIIHIWGEATGRLVSTIRGHTGHVCSVAFSPRGDRLASGGHDRTVRVWDISQDQAVASLPHAGGARNVVFSPNGRLLVASGYAHSGGRVENRVRLWDMDNPKKPRIWEGHTGPLRCVAFNPDGNLLASGSFDRTVRLWDVAAEKTVRVFKGHADIVTGVSFHCDKTCLASASLDKTVRLWDLTATQAAPRVLTHPHPVHDVALAPDGKRLVAVGAGGMVHVWDTQTLTKLFALPGHDNGVERVVFSPNGRWLATAGEDKTIRIWDMTSDPAPEQPAVPLHILVGHTERILGLCFSPDGLRLASAGSGDQTIRIWDVVSANEALTLRRQANSFTGVAFSPDGQALVASSSRDILVWDTRQRPGR